MPSASFDEYVVVARKNDNDWWLGALNNSTARNVTMKLDFLDEGADYSAELFIDAPDSETDPNRLEKRVIRVKKNDPLELSLAASGGAAIHFSKL